MLPPRPSGPVPVAFVDGTRRVEMGLWQLDPRSGQHIRGIAGVYAAGLLLIAAGCFAYVIGRLARTAA